MSSNEEKINKAFENSKYEWRTIRGVSKETGLNQEVVKRYVTSHCEQMVKSSARNEKGERLYTTRAHYRGTASVFARISSALKNRGG